ncbi:helix-turn-helix transcriptional regulator [Qipengyuania sp. 902]|uniref:helix-turn-helix transcriptional regulator n=1 Tax=Qipengyuania sp. 902 TaxID=3417565 RepID=UPI003EB6EF93
MGVTAEQLARRCEAAGFGEYCCQDLLRDIAEWVGGSKAMLLGMPGGGPYRRSLDWNHDRVAIERYNSHYNRFDPRSGLSLLTPVHQSQLGQQYVRNENIEHTEYFEAINRFGDVRDSVHGIIGDDAEFGRQSISVQRGFGEAYFELAEADRLSALLPILEKALRNSLRAARLLSAHRDPGDFAYLVVDRGLALRYADHGGCDSGTLGGAALFIARDRLAGMDCATLAVVESAVAKALEGETLSFRLGGASIEVSPLPSPLQWMGSDSVFLSIARARDAITSRAKLFAAFHNFTERETAILEVLMRETDMRRAGQAIGISYETLRWHVKNMCHKAHQARRESLIIAALSGDFGAAGG